MTKLNLASGIYTLRSFTNHDPVLDGWRFEQGLGQYPDNSIEAITESCGLTYLPLADWPAAFAEFARVLEPGGVLRIQEEWSDHPESRWFPHGYHDAVTLTTPALITDHMRATGLDVAVVTYDTTTFRDASLIQRFHGGEPNVCTIEGTKPSSV